MLGAHDAADWRSISLGFTLPFLGLLIHFLIRRRNILRTDRTIHEPHKANADDTLILGHWGRTNEPKADLVYGLKEQIRDSSGSLLDWLINQKTRLP